MKIANKIVTLRERAGMTQKEFAKKININRSVINRIEKGTRPIRDDELKKIANLFNVSIDYLLGNEGNKESEPLSEEETHLLNVFKQLSCDERRALLEHLEYLQFKHEKRTSGLAIVSASGGNDLTNKMIA